MATAQALFQLHVNGEPHGPRFQCIKYAARDAVDKGFARPDELGRIVLAESATIERVATWRCGLDSQFSLDTSCRDPRECAAAGKCLSNNSRNTH